MAEFSAENLVVVYRQNDTDSIAFAKQYQSIYSLLDEQLLAIPCSNREILPSYTDFLNEVENPIKNALQTPPIGNRQVFGFVLMPFVPGGFVYNNYKISTTSRISYISKNLDVKIGNNLYDRQTFKRYNEDDVESAYICTRIDGPLITVQQWMQNIDVSKTRQIVTGKFYIDAYSAYTYSGAENYTTDLEYFRDSYLRRLGLEIERTRESEITPDPFFPILLEDSFFWGWGADRGSRSFFRRSENFRVFFYNADFDGASDLRNTVSRTWPMMAIRANYLSTAACIEAVDASEFLQPKPFMDTLFRGATLGEAFLFSQPLLNASMTCLGDPLLKVTFPNEFIADTRNTIDEAYVKIEDFYAKAIMSNYRRSRKIDYLRNLVASGSDVSVQLDLLYTINDFYRKYGSDNYKYDFNLLTNDFFNYMRNNNRKAYEKLYIDANDFLTSTNNKISDIILDTSYNPNIRTIIDGENILPLGYWEYETTLEHYSGELRIYYMELEIARSLDDFEENNILLTIKSLNTSENWFFENSDGSFIPLTTGSLSSRFIDRKIKYKAKVNQYLNRGEFYMFRFRQVDQLTPFAWRYEKILIYH